MSVCLLFRVTHCNNILLGIQFLLGDKSAMGFSDTNEYKMTFLGKNYILKYLSLV